MVFSPIIWVMIYFLILLFPSLSLGLIAVHLPRLFNIPRISRFLIGFTVTPFILAVWMLVFAFFFPGSPRWLFLTIPTAIALIHLLLYGYRPACRLIRVWQRINMSWLAYLFFSGTIFLVAFVGLKLVNNARLPMTGHDALVYANESLEFAESRSISAIPNFKGTIDDVIPGHPHSFLYQAFLSHALMTTGSNTVGFPHDHAMRFAIQVLILYMLLAVVALASTSKYLGAGALSVLLLLQVSKFQYISYNSSRDAFRLIPLLLLAVTLTGLSPRRCRRKLRATSLLPCLILVAFSLSAHTINGVMIVAIISAWLICAVLEKASVHNILLVLGAVSTGLFLAGIHYIKSYINTGNLMGYGFVYYIYIDTPLWEAFCKTRKIISVTDAGIFRRFAMLLAVDGYKLSTQGLLSALFSMIFWFKLKQQKVTRSILFLSLIIILALFPLVGLLDFTKVKLSTMFIVNRRYILHWYPFAAVSVALLVAHLHNKVMSHKIIIKNLSVTGLILLFLALTVVSYETVKSSWKIRSIKVTKTLLEVRKIIEDIPPQERILLGDNRLSYYLHGHDTAYILSHPARKIIHAKDEREVESVLKKLEIRYVILQQHRISDWWNRTVLYSFLNITENSSLIASGDRFLVYKIK